MAPSAPGHALVMLRPCPYDGVLEVVRWQGDRYLFHRLTGECAKLPADIENGRLAMMAFSGTLDFNELVNEFSAVNN